jgi:hypothetical protein
MNKRDQSILNDLIRFRCLSRDDIIDLHFAGLKKAVTCCNNVMKRLRLEGLVEVNKEGRQFVYFAKPTPIRKDSQKIPHFLAIVDTYKRMRAHSKPRLITVEPKYGKGYCEPDMFAVWLNAPFFIEVQRSVYSKRVMQEKVARYERYWHSREWVNESWQGVKPNKPMFPNVLIITEYNYEVSSNLRIMQVPNIEAFVAKVRAQSKTPSRV